MKKDNIEILRRTTKSIVSEIKYTASSIRLELEGLICIIHDKCRSAYQQLTKSPPTEQELELAKFFTEHNIKTIDELFAEIHSSKSAMIQSYIYTAPLSEIEKFFSDIRTSDNRGAQPLFEMNNLISDGKVAH